MRIGCRPLLVARESLIHGVQVDVKFRGGVPQWSRVGFIRDEHFRGRKATSLTTALHASVTWDAVASSLAFLSVSSLVLKQLHRKQPTNTSTSVITHAQQYHSYNRHNSKRNS